MKGTKMTWNAFRWVWRLEAPIFVGLPPAGSLNRCRPYIPARTLWGAVTAEIARSESNQVFPDYGKIGREVSSNSRFTYLYPAEKSNNRVIEWLPVYEREKGMRWHRQEHEELLDRKFKHLLLDTRPGTAVAPESDSASEGSLRETECINPWWRNPPNIIREPTPVFWVGYVFLRGEEIKERLKRIDTLSLGGDTRYGLGKISHFMELAGCSSVFGKEIFLDGENPQIKSGTAWGHVSDSVSTEIFGAKELLGGWDMGNLQKGRLLWAPGSSVGNSDCRWTIDEHGYWKLVNIR